MKWLLAALALLVPFSAASQSSTGGSASEAPYQTIVIIGDTQDALSDYRETGVGATRYAELDNVIDWIVANEETENISFVMHVGDMIEHGSSLPPDGTQCDAENGSWTVPDGDLTCFNLIGSGEAACEAEPGCFWTTADGDAPTCAACHVVERTEDEWTGFELLTARLEPGGDLTDGIPFLIARGNHDNVGTQNATDTDREPQGYNQRFGDAYWDALDGDYGDRQYEHVASLTDTVNGNAHAWLVGLGEQQVLVVAISCCVLAGIDDAQEDWAIATMADYPDVPAILLAHHADAVEDRITNLAGEVAPNLFAYFGGHDSDRVKTFVSDPNSSTPDTRIMLKSETDWNVPGAVADTRDAGGTAQNDYVTLVRFYPNTSEIAVEDFSVKSGRRSTLAGNRVVKQFLDITPGDPLPDTFVSLAESTTFGPGGSIFDYSTRVASPEYVSPPTDFTGWTDNTDLKDGGCSSDETTWSAIKELIDGDGTGDAADNTRIWLPEDCKVKAFLDATYSNGPEVRIADKYDGLAFYCADPSVCGFDIRYRSTGVQWDYSTGDAYGTEDLAEWLISVGTGRYTSLQDCNWTGGYALGSKKIETDCTIATSGGNEWGPGDIVRLTVDDIQGFGDNQGTFLSRVSCVSMADGADPGTEFDTDPASPSAGECDQLDAANQIQIEDGLPMDYDPNAYYWGSSSGSTFRDRPNPTTGTYQDTSGHLIEQVERVGNGTRTNNIPENIYFIGMGWSIFPEWIGGEYIRLDNSFDVRIYQNEFDSRVGAGVLINVGGLSGGAKEAGRTSIHSNIFTGHGPGDSLCFGEILGIYAETPIRIKASATGGCDFNNAPGSGDDSVAFTSDVDEAYLAGKVFIKAQGAYTAGPPATREFTLPNTVAASVDGCENGTGDPCEGLAIKQDKYSIAGIYCQNAASNLQIVNNAFIGMTQSQILQTGCTQMAFIANYTYSPSDTRAGRGPFFHGNSGGPGSIFEANEMGHSMITIDGSNTASSNWGECVACTWFKNRAVEQTTTASPAAGDYSTRGTLLTVNNPEDQWGGSNENWNVFLNVGKEMANGTTDFDNESNNPDTYGSEDGAPHMIYNLGWHRNRCYGTGCDQDDNFASANTSTDRDNAASDADEVDEVPAGWSAEIGEEPTSLFFDSVPEFWCTEAAVCEFGEIGSYYDDFSTGTRCKLPAQILYEGTTCTAP